MASPVALGLMRVPTIPCLRHLSSSCMPACSLRSLSLVAAYAPGVGYGRGLERAQSKRSAAIVVAVAFVLVLLLGYCCSWPEARVMKSLRSPREPYRVLAQPGGRASLVGLNVSLDSNWCHDILVHVSILSRLDDQRHDHAWMHKAGPLCLSLLVLVLSIPARSVWYIRQRTRAGIRRQHEHDQEQAVRFVPSTQMT